MAASSYPALLDMTKQTLHSLRSAESFLVGRNETADVCVLDPTCSRHHFRIVRHEGTYCVEALAPQNPTYCDGRQVTQRLPLAHQAVIQAGQTHFQFLLRSGEDGGSKKSPKSSQVFEAEAARTVMAAPGQLAEATELTVGRIPLAGTMLIGREQGKVQIYLPHPQVSRLHASLEMRGGQATLLDLKSANGTFVNGDRIAGATVLRPDDQIDIGPYALKFDGSALLPRPRSNNIELVARGVQRLVLSRETGKPLALLDDVTLVIRPREFVCLLGPSGSGKSTLLSALSGRVPADSGSVQLNGKDLGANFEALKQDMAVVPQKDVLHESLSVKRALWYTAKLRLPPDTSAAEIEASLKEMLDTVGLSARAATVIRYLSGGQVKRASLANEILCKPTLLFLDEVTSGLDEQTDREMMNLFRSLADAGKTVVCITHSLANVERTCHLVVILTPGGKLAFVGRPDEALQYFRIDRLGDVYDRLAEQPAEHWQAMFLKSAQFSQYVTERLPPDIAKPVDSSQRRSLGVGKRATLFSRQLVLLTHRYWMIWRGDYPSLLAMAGQALLVALLLGILFGDLDKVKNPVEHAQRSINLLFLLAVSSFWFGCNNAAKEIVKERAIYTRERDFNLLIGSYYASKLLLLAVISGLQTVTLYVLVRLVCNLPGAYLGELAILVLLALAGVTLGLAISAASKTEEMAITLIPMAVIPQIILSGVIAPLDGFSKGIALTAISTCWGKRGLDGCLPQNVADAARLENHSSFATTAFVLLTHAGVGVAVALLCLTMQTRRRALFGKG